MWIFTNQGMVSIVKHRDKPDCLLVRARESRVLRTLFPGAKIIELPHADYRYRVVIKREDVAGLFESYIEDIDYDNFKNSISVEKHDYHESCMKVWGIMRNLQKKTNSVS